MALGWHQLTEVAYLGAAVAAALGLVLPSPRFARGAVVALAAGAGLHGLAFVSLHRLEPTPPLTSLPLAVSLMAWLGCLFYLVLLLRVRILGLAVLVAPAAFLGAFLASLSIPEAQGAAAAASPLWAHLHVLLASAGLALLGVAGGAGLLYVIHHRTIKAKRSSPTGAALPSLEALDRLNAIALAVGFLLLSLGVLTGMAWTRAWLGRLWPGGLHANATLLAWAIYALLLTARFGAGRGARQLAVQSAFGFAFLLVAVVGVGVLR